jgi:hypothetical protein
MSEMKLDAKLEQALQVGELVGQTKAFMRVAGRCTAAKAQALATIHDEKRYRVLGMDWEDFCRTKVGMNRRLADQHIREFKEFGHRYFDLAQLTPITASQYRQIASSVNQKGLVYKGETIAFTEKDAPRLTAVIAELSKAAESARKASAAGGAEAEEPYVASAESALTEAVKVCERLPMLPLTGSMRVRVRMRLDAAIHRLRDVQYSIL